MKNGEEEIGGKWGLFPDFCWIFFVAQVVLSLITTTSGCSKKAGGKNLPAKMEWKTSWYFKCIQNTWIHMIENTSDWQNSAPVELLSLSPSLAGFWTDILSGAFFRISTRHPHGKHLRVLHQPLQWHLTSRVFILHPPVREEGSRFTQVSTSTESTFTFPKGRNQTNAMTERVFYWDTLWPTNQQHLQMACSKRFDNCCRSEALEAGKYRVRSSST